MLLELLSQLEHLWQLVVQLVLLFLQVVLQVLLSQQEQVLPYQLVDPEVVLLFQLELMGPLARRARASWTARLSQSS